MSTGHSPTPIRPHTQERQEGVGTHPAAPVSSTPVDSVEVPAWKRLVSHDLPQREVIPLIRAMFTSRDEVKMIRALRGDDAQKFINSIHKVCPASFPPEGTN